MSQGEKRSLIQKWFPHWSPKPEARLRLFCFPFAGGGASLFHRWAEWGPWVDGLAVQYPGRETRFGEPPYRRVPELVEALGPVVLPLLDRPFAFFGYSLGTSVCLELTRWLARMKAPAPLGLLLAAGTPPHQERLWPLHALSEADFMAGLGNYGGTPPEVLAHQELMELLLPMLRADFEMAETYKPALSPLLSMPMAVWGGAEDLSPWPELLERWRDFTTGPFTLRIVPGGHFFLNSPEATLREDVERTVLQWLGTPE
jgi:medium-chain acyl-[acyl-carrier-protein] hydrolase